MEFIEGAIFTKRIKNLLTDEEYQELQRALINNPFAGSVISGGFGLRKLRWAISGSGKRSGLRIIYYYLTKDDQVHLIMAYKKSEQEDLTKGQLKNLIDYMKERIL